MSRQRVSSRAAAWGWVLLALAAVSLPACFAERRTFLDGVRRGSVYLQVPEETRLQVTIEPTHGPTDYAYLVAPDGRILVRKRLDQGMHATLTHSITRAGTYTLIPSPSHRMRVEIDEGRLTFEPDAEFPSLHLRGSTSLVFDVPPGCRGFTLAATNQHDWEGSAGSVRLYSPDGALVHAFSFEDLTQDRILARLGIGSRDAEIYRAQGDTAEVPEFHLLIERHAVDDPAPGRWMVELEIPGPRPDDIGVWLEGIPSLFGPAGTDPFVPVFEPGEAHVDVDPGTTVGPTGDVGAVWGWTVYRDEALAAYREMGLEVSTNFYPQVDMEPRNDDADPAHPAWAGFRFDAHVGRLEPYRDQIIPLTSLMIVSRIAPWAMTDLEEISEYAEACVRFHAVERGLDPWGLYWQFLNEPNHDVSVEEYLAAFKAAGRQVHEAMREAGREVRFGGPGTGNASQEPEDLPWPWITRLIAEADDALDFVVWNQYRLGRIEDTWRFRKHIDEVDSLLTALDTDGQHEEIVIGATNLRGGIVLQNERQDGAYSAIWWPSVLCQTLGSGRCRFINYFFLVDQGARRKGLLRADWSRKPVALATAFVNAHRRERVIAARCDHDGVDVLATSGRLLTGLALDARRSASSASLDSLSVVAVNKNRRAVDVIIDIGAGTSSSAGDRWAFVTRTFDAESCAIDTVDASSTAETKAASLRLRLLPWQIAGVTAARGDAPPAGTPDRESP